MSLTAGLKARHAAAVTNGVGTRGIYVDRAQGAELWDVDGRRYIDLVAGIAVNNTGHRHPKVMAAVAAQADRFTHTCFHVAPYESYLRLAERLNAIAPVRGPAKTMLVTTGAEAVENAIKIARVATGRPAIVAFSGAFHGRTMMGMALTGKMAPYKTGFGPFPSGVFHAPFPNQLRGITVDHAIAGLEMVLSVDVDATQVAAFIVEPVQGEGGFLPAPPAFLRRLRDLADKHGILLIADEIQTGMARTGSMFALDQTGIEADLITLAKGLAGGFPLSAVVGSADLMDAAHAGGLGGTYAGNPLAVAAANAVLDVIAEEDLTTRAARIGDAMVAKLTQVASESGGQVIAEVRGCGAMVAFELVEIDGAATPAPKTAAAIVTEAERRGVIVLVCGAHFNVIRLLPPLTIEDDLLEEGMEALVQSIRAVIAADSAKLLPEDVEPVLD